MSDTLPTEADQEEISAMPATSSPATLNDATVRASDLAQRGVASYLGSSQKTPAATLGSDDTAPPKAPPEPSAPALPSLPTPSAPPAAPEIPGLSPDGSAPPATDPSADYAAAREKAGSSLVATHQKLTALGFQPTPDSLVDIGALRAHVDSSINSALAAPQANETATFGPSRFTPEAQKIRDGLEAMRAQARNVIGDHATTLTALRSSAAAMQAAQSAPATPAPTPHIPGLDPAPPHIPGLDPASPVSDTSPAGAPHGVAGEPQPASSVLAHETGAPAGAPPTAEAAILHPSAERQWTESQITAAKAGQKPYAIDDKGQFGISESRPLESLTEAVRDGVITNPTAEVWKAAADKQALVEAAGSNPKIKAALAGAGRGAAFLATAPIGAGVGGAALSETVVGAPIGALLGGLISGTVGAWGYQKLVDTLAAHNDTINSFAASQKLHPGYSALGELTAFGAGLPRAAVKAAGAGISELADALASRSTVPGATADAVRASVSAADMARAAGVHYSPAIEADVYSRASSALDAIGKSYATSGGGLAASVERFNDLAKVAAERGDSAGAIAAAIGKRVATGAAGMVVIDTVTKQASKALGLSDEGQTLQGAGVAAVLGAMASGHGIGLSDYSHEKVGNIILRGMAHDVTGTAYHEKVDLSRLAGTPDVGIGVDESMTHPLTPEEQEVFHQFNQKAAQLISEGKISADPSEWQTRARQILVAGRKAGIASVDIQPKEKKVTGKVTGESPTSVPASPVPFESPLGPVATASNLSLPGRGQPSSQPSVPIVPVSSSPANGIAGSSPTSNLAPVPSQAPQKPQDEDQIPGLEPVTAAPEAPDYPLSTPNYPLSPLAGPALIGPNGESLGTGPLTQTHAEVKIAAARQGIDATEATHGFHTAAGELLDRQQAAQRALQTGQIDQATFDKAMARKNNPGLHAEDLLQSATAASASARLAQTSSAGSSGVGAVSGGKASPGAPAPADELSSPASALAERNGETGKGGHGEGLASSSIPGLEELSHPAAHRPVALGDRVRPSDEIQSPEGTWSRVPRVLVGTHYDGASPLRRQPSEAALPTRPATIPGLPELTNDVMTNGVHTPAVTSPQIAGPPAIPDSPLSTSASPARTHYPLAPPTKEAQTPSHEQRQPEPAAVAEHAGASPAAPHQPAGTGTPERRPEGGAHAGSDGTPEPLRPTGHPEAGQEVGKPEGSPKPLSTSKTHTAKTVRARVRALEKSPDFAPLRARGVGFEERHGDTPAFETATDGTGRILFNPEVSAQWANIVESQGRDGDAWLQRGALSEEGLHGQQVLSVVAKAGQSPSAAVKAKYQALGKAFGTELMGLVKAVYKGSPKHFKGEIAPHVLAMEAERMRLQLLAGGEMTEELTGDNHPALPALRKALLQAMPPAVEKSASEVARVNDEHWRILAEKEQKAAAMEETGHIPLHEAVRKRGGLPSEKHPLWKKYGEELRRVRDALRSRNQRESMHGNAPRILHRHLFSDHPRELPDGLATRLGFSDPNDLMAALETELATGQTHWIQPDVTDNRGDEGTHMERPFAAKPGEKPLPSAISHLPSAPRIPGLDDLTHDQGSPLAGKPGKQENSQLSTKDSQPPFFSALTRTIEALPQETMTVGQARAAIIKGAKPAEIAQQGILDDPLSPLAGKQPHDKVTKSDLLGYSLERQARVQDVVLGGEDAKDAARRKQIYDRYRETTDAIADSRRKVEEGEITPQQQSELLRKLSVERGALDDELADIQSKKVDTHFGQFQLPGADPGSYREMFVTWPTNYAITELPSGSEIVKRSSDLFFVRTPDSSQFIGSGKTAAEARDDALRTINTLIEKTRNTEIWNDGHSQYSDIANPIVRIRRNLRTDAEGRKTYFIEEMQGPGSSEQAKMPPELRKRIYEIGMKRAIRDAIDEGADAIGWTTGDQQAERYSLEKHIDSISVTSWPAAGKDMMLLTARKDGAQVMKELVPLEKLEDYIGKEAAKKIMDQPAEPLTGARHLDGENLKVGGQGLKNLYDTMLPRIANKLAEKVGGKTQKSEIPGSEDGHYLLEHPDFQSRREHSREAATRALSRLGEGWSMRADPAHTNQYPSQAIHSLPIPEAWQHEAPSFSLFAGQPGAKADVQELEHGDVRKPGFAEKARTLLHAAAQESGWDSLVDDVQKIMAPDSRLTPDELARVRKEGSLSFIPEARKAGLFLDGMTAAMDRRKRQFQAALLGSKRLVDTLPSGLQRELTLQMDEAGRAQPEPDEIPGLSSADHQQSTIHYPQGDAASVEAVRRQVMPELEKLDAQKVQEVQAAFERNGLTHWRNYENYLKNIIPHAFEDEAAANKVLDSLVRRRKIVGGTGWLKHREGFTLRDILERAKEMGVNLKLKHENPVEAVMHRWTQQDRFIGAMDLLREMEKGGIGHWETVEYTGREGERSINNIAGQRTTEIEGVPRKQNFWASEQAAQIVNNYLSRGLRDNRKWMQHYFTAANVLNSVQLGISAFHAGFVTTEGMVSELARGLQEMAGGEPLRGLKTSLGSPFSTVSNFRLGGRVQTELLHPGTHPDLTHVVDAMVSAGFRHGVDSFYQDHQWEPFRKALQDLLKGKPSLALLRAPFATIELLAKPIMEHLVPRMKAAAVVKMAEMLIRQNPEISAMELRRRLQDAVRAGNDRFGQYAYDTLHLHKTVKDLLMASTRSLGWNWGTFANIGGGLRDWSKYLPAAARYAASKAAGRAGGPNEPKAPEFTARMSYTLALPLLVGLAGALLSAMFGTKPKTLKDYYYIQTGGTDEKGDPERIALPSYMKDVAHFSRDPASTITNKLHPLLSSIAAMFRNKDYYGVEIRHPGDPWYRQALSALGYGAKQFVPFTARNTQKSLAQSSNPAVTAAGWVGITQVPDSAAKSDAQFMADKYNRERIPDKARTQEAADESAAKSRLVALMRNNWQRGHAEFEKMKEQCGFDSKTLAKIEDRASYTRLQDSVRQMKDPYEVQRVYEAATPEERKQLDALFAQQRAADQARSARAQARSARRSYVPQ